MSMIRVSHLSFAYEGGEPIFQNVSFQIDTCWKLGFTGRNGRGKTTFLNLLRGQFPYQGDITASVPFAYFPYAVADTSRPAAEVAGTVCPGCAEWQLERELSLLDVAEDVPGRPFDTLSDGERTKVLLAALFLKENRFLLIDEPTNHLDARGRQTVAAYLNRKRGFILVSHDRAFLDGCVDHILSINKTNIEVRQGNFSTWLQNKERQDAFELAENTRLKKEIRRLEHTVREKAAWSAAAENQKIGFDPVKTEKSAARRPAQAAKAKKTMKRAKAIEARRQTAVDERAGLLKNVEETAPLRIAQLPFYKDTLVTLKDVSVCYGGRTVCEHVGFTVKQGERVALTGRNGAGKSSILKLVCGEAIPHTGTAETAGRLLISRVAQDTSGLCGGLFDFARANGLEQSLFLAILRKLDFSRAQFEKDLRDFSGGQKKKVLIAKSLCEKSHLLVWDEPLNFIDIFSRMQIENLLLTFAPTILFVEHDAAFAARVATKTVAL